jgi:hypothetical protein
MEQESPRYKRPRLSLIERAVPPYGAEIYIGGMEGAGDLAGLAARNSGELRW